MNRALRNPFLSFCILSASVHGAVLALLAAPQPRILVTSPAISVQLAAPTPDHDVASTATGGQGPKPSAAPKAVPGGSSVERITPVAALPRQQAPAAATGSVSRDALATVKEAQGKRSAGPETEKSTGSEAGELSEKESERRRNLARTLVSEALRAHLNYPLLARKHGWQGRVRLRLQIVDHGRITGIRLVQSSGYGVLDRAALQSLSLVAKLNPLSRWPLLHDLDIVIPVEYRLLDS